MMVSKLKQPFEEVSQKSDTFRLSRKSHGHRLRMMYNVISRLTGVFLVALATGVSAQSVPHSTLHMIDRYAVNPAFAGLESSLSVTADYRTQWVGLPGNPVQKYLNAHLPFYLWKGALGMEVYHESIGAQKALHATLSYNYVLETSIGLFSAGLGAGLTQQSLDGSILRAPDGEYEGPTIIHHDPVLPNGVVSGIAPLFRAGVYFAGDRFEAGIGVENYTPGTIKLDGVEIRDRAAVNVFAEYFIESLRDINLYPTVFLMSDLVRTQINIALRAEYRDFLIFGAGVRGYSGSTLDALELIGGLRLSDHLHVYYSYDLTLSALNAGTEGSHEVMLRYNLGKVIGAGLPPPIIYSPRF